MPTIEYSPGLAASMYTTLMNLSGSPPDNNYQFTYGAQSTAIGLYSNPMPTTLSQSTTTDIGNLLCSWHVLGNTTETASFPNTTFNSTTLIWTITTFYRRAAASGTAQHFKLMNHRSTNSDIAAGSSVYGIALGTVGLIGSGADLEMGNTSIVAGRRYRIQNLQIQFPRTFTY